MKRAFTLIELIVAMAIMLLLAALVIGGVRSMLDHQREAATRQTLQTVNGLLAVRMRAIGTNVYPDQWYFNGVYGNHNTAGPGLWIAAERHYTIKPWAGAYNPDGSQYIPPGDEVRTPLSIVDTAIPEDYSLWTSDLFRNTALIFNDIDRSVEGRKGLDALRTAQVTVTINGANLTARIPLDGWNRPVLFSPATGYVIGAATDGATVYGQSGTQQFNSNGWTGGGATFPFAFSAGSAGNPSEPTSHIR